VQAAQKPLGGQLAVRVYDETSRDAEIRGKHPGRRQSHRGRQPARANGVTQTVGELSVQRLQRGAVQLDQQLRTGSGTRNRHQSGAYPEAIEDLA
jgi:hypothetical protein